MFNPGIAVCELQLGQDFYITAQVLLLERRPKERSWPGVGCDEGRGPLPGRFPSTQAVTGTVLCDGPDSWRGKKKSQKAHFTFGNPEIGLSPELALVFPS